MKHILFILSIVVILSACQSNKKTTEKKASPQGDIALNNYVDSVSYSLGILYGEGLKKQGFDDLNNELLLEVFRQSVENELNADSALITQQNASPIVNNYFIKKREAIAQANLTEGAAFLEANKTKEGVKTTASGLQYKVLKKGSGKNPIPSSSVTVRYKGTLLDGQIFDQTKDHPSSFGVGGVIKGWQEGLLLMKEGAKFRFFVPGDLAYGSNGYQGTIIGPNATLIFDVELEKVN